MAEIIVIIVTYNGKQWIRKCLENLRESLIPVKTIIVDNNSTDDMPDYIGREFPEILLRKQDRNLGFGQANNIAIRDALARKADYVFLLNQDAYVFPDTIAKLVSAMQEHPDYGILSPLQLNAGGTALDARFRSFISNNYPEDFVHTLETGDPGHIPPFPVHFVNAASWMLSRKCIETTGLFHPMFYHYGEDNNFCSRVQYHGLKTGILPATSVIHDRSLEKPGNRTLLQKISLVPLYVLLDLRKNLLLAWVLACWKLVGFAWKGAAGGSWEIIRATVKQTGHLMTSWARIKKARAEMKGAYGLKNKPGPPFLTFETPY